MPYQRAIGTPACRACVPLDRHAKAQSSTAHRYAGPHLQVEPHPSCPQTQQEAKVRRACSIGRRGRRHAQWSSMREPTWKHYHVGPYLDVTGNAMIVCHVHACGSGCSTVPAVMQACSRVDPFAPKAFHMPKMVQQVCASLGCNCQITLP